MISSEIAAIADALVGAFGIDPDEAVKKAYNISGFLSAAGYVVVERAE